jgi:hypothetical protein
VSTAHTLTINSGPSGLPNPVASGGIANLSVTATDSLGHTLTYGWSASCPTLASNGLFGSPALASTTWTAPANTTGSVQNCTMQVTVNDGAGGLSVLPIPSYVQGVSTAHTLTINSGPSGLPNPVGPGGIANLTVTATDSNAAHVLTYLWSVLSCPGLTSTGSFNNAASRTPAWTAPANTTGSAKTCTIRVTVNDGNGLIQTPSYAQVVNPILFAAPTGVTATLSGVTRQVHLVWTDNSTIETRYQVQRCKIVSGFCSYSTVASSLPANTTSFNNTVATAGTYRFRVQACTATSCTGYGTSNNIAVP